MRRLSLTAILGIAVIAVNAQTPTPQKPAFDVASIKPNNSGLSASSLSVNSDSGYFKATNITLRRLVISSYRLLDYQLVGGPDWINTARCLSRWRTMSANWAMNSMGRPGRESRHYTLG